MVSASVTPSPTTVRRLSQTQLNLLATCPRKFQHVYLEQLSSPGTPEQQEKQVAGTRFHLLLQQWQMELPIEPLVQEDAQLQRWFSAFVKAAPEILKLEGSNEVLRQSEHERTLKFGDYLLTVVYDLLITTGQQAQILDWKTYPHPQNVRFLLQNWQTRLYPFVLAETSAYAPEQISMIYWFFQASGEQATEPQSFKVTYDRTKHEQTRQDLSQLLGQLSEWLAAYQTGGSFPQTSVSFASCETCNFVTRCDRLSDSETPPSTAYSLPNLSEIEEIPL